MKKFEKFLKQEGIKKDGLEYKRIFTFKHWSNYGKERIYIQIKNMGSNHMFNAYIDLTNENKLVVDSKYDEEIKLAELAKEWFFENYYID